MTDRELLMEYLRKSIENYTADPAQTMEVAAESKSSAS